MADDKSAMNAAAGAQGGASRGYDVDYLAKRHGITLQQAEALIARHGKNARGTLDVAAEKLKMK